MDDELEAIRRARMAELQKSAGDNASDTQNEDQEQKNSVLAQLLNNEARERLSRIRIVREDRARAVEQLLVRMARSGQISRKLTEPELVSLLEQIKGPSGPKIVYNRRGDEDQPIVEENSNKDDSEDDFFD